MARRDDVAKKISVPLSKKASQSSSAAKPSSSASLSQEVRDILNQFVDAQKYTEDNFETRLNNRADWILIRLLLQNDSEGRSTVVKHVIETVGCSPGTVRMMFSRFQKAGYIETQDKIGRSELYRPTAKLERFITKWAQANFLDS